MATGTISPTPATPVHAFAEMTNPHLAIPMAGSSKPIMPTLGSATVVRPRRWRMPMTRRFFVGLNAGTRTHGRGVVAIPVRDLATPASAPAATASLAGVAHGSSGVITEVGVGSGGATAARLQQARDENGLNINGTGIKVGVLFGSFNDLGGAAMDEADGALPSASNVDVITDLASVGTDEGRAMIQIIHHIAPGASEAFYTASDSEQGFANCIFSLAVPGSKVIVDDVRYSDEPFFQNGVVAQGNSNRRSRRPLHHTQD
jgi:hypothetical protein